MNEFRTGTVSIVGRSNVGKSTLLNHFIEQKLSIVSNKSQTTRWALQGIKTTAAAQIIFIDTPGLQKSPKQALNRYMNKAVTNSLYDVDIILFVIESLKWNALDAHVLNTLKGFLLQKTIPTNIILVINKVDKLIDKNQLLSFISMVSNKFQYSEIIPISALKGVGTKHLELAITKSLPIAPALFPSDQLADKGERFFAAEFIREKLMTRLSEELPYCLSITIDEFKTINDMIHIIASIWVDKTGQKAMIIGKQGKVLKAVGKAARQELEVLYDKKVNLKTWVKVKKKWADSEQSLRQLGYL